MFSTILTQNWIKCYTSRPLILDDDLIRNTETIPDDQSEAYMIEVGDSVENVKVDENQNFDKRTSTTSTIYESCNDHDELEAISEGKTSF